MIKRQLGTSAKIHSLAINKTFCFEDFSSVDVGFMNNAAADVEIMPAVVRAQNSL